MRESAVVRAGQGCAPQCQAVQGVGLKPRRAGAGACMPVAPRRKRGYLAWWTSAPAWRELYSLSRMPCSHPCSAPMASSWGAAVTCWPRTLSTSWVGFEHYVHVLHSLLRVCYQLPPLIAQPALLAARPSTHPSPPHPTAPPAVIIAWVAGLMTPFFWVLNKLGLMRVSADVEALGLDIRCGPLFACELWH